MVSAGSAENVACALALLLESCPRGNDYSNQHRINEVPEQPSFKLQFKQEFQPQFVETEELTKLQFIVLKKLISSLVELNKWNEKNPGLQ
ncbi:hypothetical protein DCAR_0623499 [Daucus carota subsp. sativus]|uniref:Uncharacterized protein n=1 Tax=Daucus carota subsp. sativus TaxID=79200 RepID=A0A164V8P1_DAUCS|nr:hypothetical protein DCAR_0623499 [Daucus carota subsp. sativus]